MKRLCLLVMATIATCAAAGGPALETLPTNAQWVAHLNLQALTETSPGKTLLANATSFRPFQKLKAFTATFGNEIPVNLTAVTACGTGRFSQGGVAYLHGSWDLRKLSAQLAGSTPSTTSQHGRHTILSWHDATAPKGYESTSICLLSSDLILLANQPILLLQALDAVDGKVPSLATMPWVRRLTPADANAIFSAFAANPAERLADVPFAAALPAINTLELTLLADQQEARLQGIAQAPSLEAAQQLQLSLTALKTVALLQSLQNPDLAAITRSAHIHTTGHEVRITLSAPFATLQNLLTRPCSAPGHISATKANAG